jgi:hypothetical protein
VWCGARNGLTPHCRKSNPCALIEAMAAVSSASVSLSGGRMPGSRLASMVLPVPGGPINSRL